VEKPILRPVQRLEWVVDPKIQNAFSEAQAYINETIGDSDVEVLHYAGYGTDFIKAVGKVSPDAYSQICLHLTFYRMHGYCAAVYETASTRQFNHGRTETCRSLTPAAFDFVKVFQDPSKSVFRCNEFILEY
jgi:carnitine O-acetyltransferase